MVGPLSQMHLQQLMQLMLNPRPEGPPLYAVLSAITEKQKQAQAQASMQRQMAMAQGQQAAQQPPIAQQVLAQAQQMQPEEPVMAAYGGEMQGYAGGGAVAFNRGGGVQHFSGGSNQDGVQSSPASRFLSNLMGDVRESLSGDPEADKLRQQIRAQFSREAGLLGVFRSQSDQERQRAQEIMRLLPTMDKEQMRHILGQTQRTVDPAAYQEFGPGERVEQLASAASAPLSPATPPAAAPRPPGATRPSTAQGQNRPQAAPAPAQPLIAAPADLSPEMQKIYADREAEMRRRLTRPESLVAAEQGLTALAKSNIEAQQAEAKTYGEEIRAARDAAMAKAQRGFLDDPQALLSLAGSIDTRRGRGLGSLARGAAGIMGGKEAAAEAARKEFAQAQRDERSMQANLRQTQMLEAQRQVALEQGKLNEVNAINDKLAQLGIEREQFRLNRGDKAFEQGAKQRELAVLEAGLKLREDEAKRGPVLSFQDQLTRDAVEAYLKQNPGKTKADALEWMRGAGKGVEGRERLNNLKLAAETLSKQLENPMLSKADKDSKSADLNRVQAEIMSLIGMGGISAEKLPQQAVSQLKEGVVTKFANGQQWTLRNGQPTQVK
jgi:hypothetical protein